MIQAMSRTLLLAVAWLTCAAPALADPDYRIAADAQKDGAGGVLWYSVDLGTLFQSAQKPTAKDAKDAKEELSRLRNLPEIRTQTEREPSKVGVSPWRPWRPWR